MAAKCETNGRDATITLPKWVWVGFSTTAIVVVAGWASWTSTTLWSLGNEVSTISADMKNVVKTVDKIEDRIFERHAGP